MAIRLAKYFGNSEQFWLNLQNAFAVYHARRNTPKNSKPSRLWRPAPRPGEGGQDGHSRSQDVEPLQSVHLWADRTEPQFM